MGNEMKLKPCPFCGGEAEIISMSEKFTVSCGTGGCMANISYCSDKQSAVKAWNKRASDWIPCSERMPEDGQRVLICTGMRKMFVAAYNASAYMFMQRVHSTLHTWYSEEVTHWMPLPEPPKGEKQ